MKILVIQLYQTGDVALSTHIPKELRTVTKDPVVDFLTFQANRPVVENSPYINEILTIKRGESFFSFLRFISTLRSKKYDAVIDLHNNPRSGLITLLSGAKMRITYDTTKRKIFYNTLPKRLKGIAGQIKLSLLAPFADGFVMEEHDYKPILFTSEKSRAKAAEVLDSFGIKDSDLFITMSPTHKKDTRRWRINHFADTAKYLTANYDAKIIMTYGPGEKEYITENVPEMPENVFLMPELGLDDFIALIGRAKLHIGNDSAPHHIATGQNVPTFIILCSSNDGWVYGSPQHTHIALGLECQPCGKSTCRISEDIPCGRDLTFEMIKEKLDRFLAEQVLSDKI